MEIRNLFGGGGGWGVGYGGLGVRFGFLCGNVGLGYQWRVRIRGVNWKVEGVIGGDEIFEKKGVEEEEKIIEVWI